MHKMLCFPKLLKRDALQGAVLNGWKMEWLGWALNAEGDVDTPPA